MTRPFAVLFPGQGAQEVGMGRDLFAADGFTLALFELASDTTHKDLAALCLKGPDRVLAETQYLQPSLTAVCLGLWRRFAASGLIPTAAAGHSVGELAALSACGAASPETAVRSAAARGRLMGAAAAAHPGGMAAVSGVSLETVEHALAEITQTGGTLVIGAVNAPEQVTVSGDKALVEAFVKSEIRRHARVTPLRVSGAWHSPHMAEAAVAFEQVIGAAEISNAAIPLIRNRDGRPAETVGDLRLGLAGQLVRPVRWDRVMGRLLDMGIRDFVEIGPGKVLRGLIRLNDEDPSISVHNISDLRSLDRAVSALQNG